MTVDPYRELAKKNRQEIQKVHVEKLESNETDNHSRIKRREEEKPRRNPLLTILLVSFILIPILTGVWYSYEQSKKEPSNLEVIEKAYDMVDQ
ncbi:hypothetical protein [Bacillus sp. FJAT-42315]|uniref:hypothetical protein n=1 Tax=Bacillus sp. FJAT-42315 TaxID=2014077 RepID=UPI000BA903E1|nr:hypothetical protein [Bacillus sp. FJAT-42315]PAQ16220.1 hypothetical protein CD798_02325 [Bacillaceae bacterium SAOS 7]